MRTNLILLLFLSSATPLHADEWKFDVVYLKNKERFDGLIVEETREAVRFKSVVRKPGARTLVFTTIFTPMEIDRIERLGEADRRELARRLVELDGWIEREKARMAALPADPIPWEGPGQGLRYTGKYFVLVSNAREDIVRRVIVRLEDMFEAFTKHLGTRRQPMQLTKITLYRTAEEYQRLLKTVGLSILNPAYYDPRKNEIVAASDLERLAEELDRIRQKHQTLLEELRTQEKKLKAHFGGPPPPAMLAQLRQVRRKIDVVNNENECAFDRSNTRLYTTLYHEAFHAYLDNFVFPSTERTVPRWLNEGLAQIFETALVETGELRVGHLDADRLTRVKDAVRKKGLVPLADLLNADEKAFHVAHARDEQASDRYFFTSWALAYYLTFDRKLLGSDALGRYVLAPPRGGDRVQAFRDLVNQPLPEFEKQFQQYLLNLRLDGSQKAP